MVFVDKHLDKMLEEIEFVRICRFDYLVPNEKPDDYVRNPHGLMPKLPYFHKLLINILPVNNNDWREFDCESVVLAL